MFFDRTDSALTNYISLLEPVLGRMLNRIKPLSSISVTDIRCVSRTDRHLFQDLIMTRNFAGVKDEVRNNFDKLIEKNELFYWN